MWIIPFLPKRFQDAYVQRCWNKKSDEQILNAYHDATQWISTISWMGSKIDVSGSTEGISDDCKKRLNNWILPQMEKRELKGYICRGIDE